MPTPNAQNFNDGETTSWLERRERLKVSANNGNGAGMPIAVWAALLPGQLVPTPTASDADSSRNASALRSAGAEGKPGRTLTDFVDPTNGGRMPLPDGVLLPSPRVSSTRSSRRAMVENRQWSGPSLEQALEMIDGALPREFRSADEVPGAWGDAVREVGLLPTPRASANENRQTRPTPSQLAGKHGMNLATAVNTMPDVLMPTPRSTDANGADPPNYRPEAQEDLGARVRRMEADTLLPSPTVAVAPNNNANALQWRGYNTLDEMAKHDAFPDRDPPVKPGTKAARTLAARGLLPTPTGSDRKGAGPLDRRPATDDSLPTRVARLAADSPGVDILRAIRLGWSADAPLADGELLGAPTAHPRTHDPRQVDHGVQLANQAGGPLNPAFVEWMMGVPDGWTEVAPDGEPELPSLRHVRDVPPGGPWAEERPGVTRTAHGVPRRPARLKGLGNAVVVQWGQYIGEQIMAHAGAA